VLLVHGDEDRNVPLQQRKDVVEKLRDQKVTFEELISPDEFTACSAGTIGSVPIEPLPNFSTADWLPPATPISAL
jgi:hypothetical protein